MAPGLRRTQDFMRAARRYYQQAAKAQPRTLAGRIYPNLPESTPPPKTLGTSAESKTVKK